MTKQNDYNYTIEQEKLDKLAESWSRMVDCISHDLLSTLIFLRTTGERLALTSKLVKVYKTAVEKGLIEPDIEERDLKSLERLTPQIVPAVLDMKHFLDLFRPYNKQLISKSENIQVFTALTSINHLLNNYPFDSPDECSLVHVDCQADFKFKCAPLFIENLLDNLLRNALFHIKLAKKGEIHIWTELSQDGNSIHFKDTADGISEFVLPSVFNRFFSKRDGKIVPGLGFCRLAILQMGGDVLCESVREKYTHFIVKFPCHMF